jgi:hypothetical protein
MTSGALNLEKSDPAGASGIWQHAAGYRMDIDNRRAQNMVDPWRVPSHKIGHMFMRH